MSNKLPKKSSGDESCTKAVVVPDKKELKKYTPEETRKILIERAHALGDLDVDLTHFGNNILPRLLHGNGTEQRKMQQKDFEQLLPVMFGLEVDTHTALMASFEQNYQGMARELSIQIIKENNCTTHTEKLLVEVIVNAFIRTIDASKQFSNGGVPSGGSITEVRTKYIAVLSKQLDRANRQFLSSLMMLKQIKAPMVQMNIKATTAFVAQNQQVNASQQGNEINEPK